MDIWGDGEGQVGGVSGGVGVPHIHVHMHTHMHAYTC